MALNWILALLQGDDVSSAFEHEYALSGEIRNMSQSGTDINMEKTSF